MLRFIPVLTLLLVAQPVPLELRPAGELAEDRFVLACRAKEDAQEQYNRGLVATDQLLAWDERVLEAYLATCHSAEDRLKGLRYYLDRATAVHDFEKRRVTGRGGEPTPEYLEALYAMHTAAQRVAEAEKNPQALAESNKARIAASQQGFGESLRLLKQGKAKLEKPLLWSNRWVHSVWVSTPQETARTQAVNEHLVRIGTVEAALKEVPPARARPPIIDGVTEIAFRRAEASVWLAPSAQLATPLKQRSEQTQRGVDLLLEAFRKDKVGIEPVLLWLDRWTDARTGGQEELVMILRQLEPLARQHQLEGSRYIAESDLLSLACYRLGAEHDLALARMK